MVKLTWTPPKIESQIAKHSWLADYAADVHEGQYFEEYDMPGRPWVDWVLAEQDFAAMVADSYHQGKGVNAAFAIANDKLAFEFDEACLEDRWHWPRETTRSTGEVVTSPRNIMDTGYLISSRRLSIASA